MAHKKPDLKNRPFEKDISACGIIGYIDKNGDMTDGTNVLRAISVMNERSNGLGAGFAAYGIYPQWKECYALHLMYDHSTCKEKTEQYIKDLCIVEGSEQIPTRKVEQITDEPILLRYFVIPKKEKLEAHAVTEDDFIVNLVIHINVNMEGAFVMSSGKNMGVFKAVGFPEDVHPFYRLDEYKAYTWIAHGRFPTNTPGWWGGAHPFTILDWSIVHNGEISSYGINKRFLEMHGYICTLLTDTEVVAYLMDLLVRRHKLPLKIACKILAAPFWKDIDLARDGDREFYQTLRMTYSDAMLNGPFAFLFGYNGGLMGLSDRIKLRPLVAAEDHDTLYIASEECAIREICPQPEKIWRPKGGEPVIGELKDKTMV